VVPPHSTEQSVLPWQSRVQPPSGHLIAHLLLPVHVSVEPPPSEMLQSLPPPQVTELFVPVVRLHVLVPLQVEVQFDWQLPEQVDCPAQSVVQPVPHVESQVFLVWQSKVTLFGGAAPLVPPSAPASAPVALPLAAPPKEHVPPVLHVHVAPEHWQSPEHEGLAMSALPLSPPQPAAALPPTAPIVDTPSATKVNESRRFVMPSIVPRMEPYQTQSCSRGANQRRKSATMASHVVHVRSRDAPDRPPIDRRVLHHRNGRAPARARGTSTAG